MTQNGQTNTVVTKAVVMQQNYTDVAVSQLRYEVTQMRVELDRNEKRAHNGRFVNHIAFAVIGFIVSVIAIKLRLDATVASSFTPVISLMLEGIDRIKRF